MLGALGPALGDFVPFESATGFGEADQTPYYAAWKFVLTLAFGDPSQTPPLPGIVPTLATLQQTLSKLITLVQNRDFTGIMALRSSNALADVNGAFGDLTAIYQFFSSPSNLLVLSNLAGQGPIINDPNVLAPPNVFTGRDYLHWKQTGAFTNQLMADATASGDARFIAYAHGWQTALASLVSGSAFLGSIVGSVYRTWWWRTRYIANFVDAWTWGFYLRDDGVGETDYDDWPSLCDAGLQNWIAIAEPLDASTVAPTIVAGLDAAIPKNGLPDDFVTYWLNAWSATYGPVDPTATDPTEALFTSDRLQVGYLMTWLVLWFQTSGAVIGCNPNPGSPPAACGANPQAPKWVNPTIINPVTQQPFVPPTPTISQEPNDGEIVCGVILALLGLFGFAFGAGAVGAAEIIAGIDTVVNGEEQLNWDSLECQLYWLSEYLFNGLTALHQITVIGSFQQPYASDLASATQTISFAGESIAFVTGATQNCQSAPVTGPLQPWNGAPDWFAYPPSPLAIETPTAEFWTSVWWPSAIVDDTGVNPVQASILTPPASYDVGVSESFGPAVQNALTLIADPEAAIPNWNLDNDRGQGWLTWELSATYVLPVNAVPET